LTSLLWRWRKPLKFGKYSQLAEEGICPAESLLKRKEFMPSLVKKKEGCHGKPMQSS
jgi:hypothetical protein